MGMCILLLSLCLYGMDMTHYCQWPGCPKRLNANNTIGFCYQHKKAGMRKSLHWATDTDKGKQRIKRECLKCDREFMARDRFNRICPTCAETNKYISGSKGKAYLSPKVPRTFERAALMFNTDDVIDEMIDENTGGDGPKRPAGILGRDLSKLTGKKKGHIPTFSRTAPHRG